MENEKKMKMPPKASRRTEESCMVSVLLAYDTARTCGSILGMLDRISTRLRDKKLFCVKAFKFGLLEQMDPLKWKAGRPGATELAMVAFGDEGPPGADLLRWLEKWAKRHAGQDAALGLLPMGLPSSQSVRRVVLALKEMAARHSLGFICDARDFLGPLYEQDTAVA
jgi:hypothetical protein